VFIRGAAALPGFGPGRIFVKLGVQDDQSHLGIGEASPLSSAPHDVAMRLAMTLGDVCSELAPLDASIAPREAIEACLAPVEAAIAWSPQARFALETALFDVLGVRLGRSLASCLAGHRPRIAKVACNALLDASKDDLAAKAIDLEARGLRAIKIKLRARDEEGFTRELAALEALRRVLPLPFELRLDPNGAWGLDEAREKLERLASIAPRYVEQPVPAELLPELGQTAVPWAADESLCLPGMAERLAHAEGCFAFILKPAALGGLLRAIEIAELGAAAGRELVVTHYLDGPVGLAAASELACALPKEPLACGLEPHEGLAAYPDLPRIQHTKPGFVARTSRPGLGYSEEDRRRWMQMS